MKASKWLFLSARHLHCLLPLIGSAPFSFRLAPTACLQSGTCPAGQQRGERPLTGLSAFMNHGSGGLYIFASTDTVEKCPKISHVLPWIMSPRLSPSSFTTSSQPVGGPSLAYDVGLMLVSQTHTGCIHFAWHRYNLGNDKRSRTTNDM
ncbi:hypothetical protein BU25DRAFT_421862 [Macroventuria anomochaeta]|uniref:Uncharacterized protein n=1 Tax=Macroventuria anomochaeta TaxID=301207 RepID=A0ACB6S0H5_9PLEO|nr:uncharacterized protein BU25DRAFT_421862 [Macroventuria anomochaeta]KAF2627448.1 hypothetical protein BU25DRAFT_421862 [Macroventuria anomochaeta]